MKQCEWFTSPTDRCPNPAVERWSRKGDLDSVVAAEKHWCGDHSLDSKARAEWWERVSTLAIGHLANRSQVLTNFDVQAIDE